MASAPDIETTDATTTQTRAERLASFKEKWCNGHSPSFFQKLPRQDLLDMGVPHEELRAAGLLDGNEIESDCPAHCSIRQLAIHLEEVFGKKVGKMTIQHYLGTWLKPVRKDSESPINRDLAVKLWRENIGGSREDAETEAELKKDILRIERETKQHDLDESKRNTDGKWILFAVVRGYVNGMAARLCGGYDRLVEDKNGFRRVVCEILKVVGISDELIARIDAEMATRFVAANDGLKADFAKSQKDALKTFEEERKKQVKGQNI